MLISRPPDIAARGITDERLYLRRRDFLAGTPAAATATLFGCRSAPPEAPRPPAPGERQVRGVPGPAGAGPDARPAAARPRMAVRRGVAHRRGDAPADDAGGGPLRKDIAESGRRPHPAGRAVEVRIQEHQVDREGAAG